MVINLNGLKVLASSYLHGVDLTPIDEAWEFIRRIHGKRQHFSGESHVQHSLEVASTLASMHLDLDTILAGMLHGALKEDVSVEQLEEKFGKDVALIVDGSTRITNVRYNSKIANQAENVRKMLLAIADDIRVLLVRLVDRLTDMFLLDMADRELQQEIARETMDLYAPLASRLGIDWLKRELEDNSFKFLYEQEYYELSSKLESSLEERQKYVEEVIAILHEKLTDNNIKPIRIIGRPKHLYSIYKKLVIQNIPLERVYDKVAFRIITHTVNECYEVLGTVHANWAPVPARIKDFISAPKANNYQSMHTTVVGPRDHFIEIQIRTEEMDRVAQEGVAAHWAYKEGQKVSSRDARLCNELKKLVSSLQDVDDPREFLDSVKGELYDPDVYALTPTGEVKEFPLGSCPIDFAYSIHTEVGDRCVGAKINGRLVPLKHKLQNGDIVEIVTSSTQVPRRGWLDLVKTSRARARIRSWLRREEKEKALKLGREICDKAVRKHDTTLKKLIKSGQIKLLLKELRCNSLDDMLVKVGSGVITVQHLVKALVPPELRKDDEQGMDPVLEELVSKPTGQHVKTEKHEKSGIKIDGIDGILVKVAQCCQPVPGDSIVGFITMGRGVTVHRADCVNLLSSDPRRWLDVAWSGNVDRQFTVAIHVTAENRRGIFAEISAAISHDNANIVEMSAHTTAEDLAELKISLEVENLGNLTVILQHLRQLPEVITVRRI
ncbi:MAG: bifunctional (p)ppGpp synthetase/guanosine-3',5'-bis(diphosphate) 3'-pyrophosphohydrolase [Deltaproteobacteria bacterium]|nr:bifunctional (p)ppGpp synthetase/guanosine-3',5'-bis(diphosphate) 3'-pyrophosphohydrolase [Deltaproteobacteria bacterium]MBW2658710.1 bifunctional (p)ppGpp synthetase/guanosine-3',5'-bis(diphosphate) 3'-pyrophosphohydrolase [Deltaproteobacteria bacterium]